MTDPSERPVLSKRDAVRHLIHTSIRLIIDHEDPFAIHLLIQSADKILIDLSKKLGKELRIDWELYVKDEYHREFFEKHRALYNFLKHANKDSDTDIPVPDIMTRNLMDLYVAIANYTSLFAEKTNHMVLFQIFVLQVFPDIIIPPEHLRSVYAQGSIESQNMTPREFFDLLKQRDDLLPSYHLERLQDLKHLGDFYSLTFSELRRGVNKNPRVLRVPGA
jgi:hypothetical protein